MSSPCPRCSWAALPRRRAALLLVPTPSLLLRPCSRHHTSLRPADTAHFPRARPALRRHHTPQAVCRQLHPSAASQACRCTLHRAEDRRYGVPVHHRYHHRRVSAVTEAWASVHRHRPCTTTHNTLHHHTTISLPLSTTNNHNTTTQGAAAVSQHHHRTCLRRLRDCRPGHHRARQGTEGPQWTLEVRLRALRRGSRGRHPVRPVLVDSRRQGCRLRRASQACRLRECRPELLLQDSSRLLALGGGDYWVAG